METRPGKLGPHQRINELDPTGAIEQPPLMVCADHGLIGNSKPIKALIALIAKVASAICDGIDDAARRIWDVRPYISSRDRAPASTDAPSPVPSIGGSLSLRHHHL